MANIATYLAAIRNAIYGEEVRGSIADALEAINEYNSADKIVDSDYNIKIGHSSYNHEGNVNNVIIGRLASIPNQFSNYSISIGHQALVYGTDAIAIGDSAEANGSNSISIGNLAGITSTVTQEEVHPEYSISIGAATCTGDRSIAIGYNAVSKGNDVIQIGEGINDQVGTVKIKGTTILNRNGKIPMSSIYSMDLLVTPISLEETAQNVFSPKDFNTINALINYIKDVYEDTWNFNPPLDIYLASVLYGNSEFVRLNYTNHYIDGATDTNHYLFSTTLIDKNGDTQVVTAKISESADPNTDGTITVTKRILS